MSLVKAASILTLIGGIFASLISLFTSAMLISIGAISSADYGYSFGVGVFLGILAALYFIIGAILVIIASQKMKEAQTRKKWSIIAIIFSIIGPGTILGLIGGILGLVAND